MRGNLSCRSESVLSWMLSEHISVEAKNRFAHGWFLNAAAPSLTDFFVCGGDDFQHSELVRLHRLFRRGQHLKSIPLHLKIGRFPGEGRKARNSLKFQLKGTGFN
jgi:hypothetical protein